MQARLKRKIMIKQAFRGLIEIFSVMMQTIFSLLQALAYYPRYLATEVFEFVVTVIRYYPNAQFRRADLLCLWAYLMRSPDKICQRYLRDFSNNRVQKIYGETFFTTLETIAK